MLFPESAGILPYPAQRGSLIYHASLDDNIEVFWYIDSAAIEKPSLIQTGMASPPSVVTF